MRAQLLPLDGGQPIEIVKDLIVVGRKEDCDLRLEHKSVSKMHCVIVKTDGLLLLRDLGSTNGTRVNGTRVPLVLPRSRNKSNPSVLTITQCILETLLCSRRRSQSSLRPTTMRSLTISIGWPPSRGNNWARM